MVYRNPNINEEDNTKIQIGVKEVSKGECIVLGDYLEQLTVNPGMGANIKVMKDNKIIGVDGIPPKLIMETVEQIIIKRGSCSL